MIKHLKFTVFESNNLRFYKSPDGQSYPSITSVLGRTMDEDKQKSLVRWQDSLGKAKADAYTKTAADKGTAVHLLIERYLNKEDLQLSKFSPFDIKVFTALKLKLNKIKVEAQEIALYSSELGVAGRCDCIGYYKDLLSIIDFKTSNRNKTDKDVFDYKLQICFYALACNEMFGTEITQGVILMSTGEGFPLEWVFNISDYIAPLQEKIDLFYSKFL
jgi:ATP-dependent exoDNAse (exonuclease V) beta subunit